MNHEQLVEEWKKKLHELCHKHDTACTRCLICGREEYNWDEPCEEGMHEKPCGFWMEIHEKLFMQAMLAAAKGAADAGKVKRAIEHKISGFSDFDISTANEKLCFNSAISASEEQLKSYFKEV